MKRSIALSVLILVIAVTLGWEIDRRLAGIDANEVKLIAEAARLGIPLAPSNSADSIRITKRDRGNPEAEARLLASEFIAAGRELENISPNDNAAWNLMKIRLMDLADRIPSLGSSGLKILLAEIGSSQEFKDETRSDLLSSLIRHLSKNHPDSALLVFTETSGHLTALNQIVERLISSTLATWANDNPAAASEWIRQNGGKYPAIITDRGKAGFIASIAAQDPKLAFKLLGGLNFEDSFDGLSAITSAPKTGEERTATLAAIHEYLPTIEDEKKRQGMALSLAHNLASAAPQQDFESYSKWITTAGFSTAELESFVQGVGHSHSIKSGEAGQWVEWLGANFPSDKANEVIGTIVGNWTTNDYQAAGKWLAATPDGPPKTAAVQSYAQTVFQRDPEVALQWIMTLPPGEGRETTFKQIHKNWPKGDPAGAEAFKQEHGIK